MSVNNIPYLLWKSLSRKRKRHWYRQLDRQSPKGHKLNPEYMEAKYECYFDPNPYRIIGEEV